MSAPNPMRLRVECIRAIVTEEGDLIVAGTPGTVIQWSTDFAEGLKPHTKVEVRWDRYLFAPTGDIDRGSGNADVNDGLFADAEVDNLRWSDR